MEWHFASINSRWTKRALTTAGFGYLDSERFNTRRNQHWNPVYTFASVEDNSVTPRKPADVEAQDEIEHVGGQQGVALPGKVSTVHGQNRPFFHIDVPAAVESAIAGVEHRLAHVSSGSSAGKEVVQSKQE